MIVEIALTSMIICLSKEMYELSLVCLALVCVFGLIRLHRKQDILMKLKINYVRRHYV